eukprot:8588551-Alexandrium_andersonii.AAC.1
MVKLFKAPRDERSTVVPCCSATHAAPRGAQLANRALRNAQSHTRRVPRATRRRTARAFRSRSHTMNHCHQHDVTDDIPAAKTSAIDEATEGEAVATTTATDENGAAASART